MAKVAKVKIEKGVPLPKRLHGNQPVYPWREMEVGDSFVIPGTNLSSRVGYANAKFAPKHFIARTEGNGTRIWRDK